MNMIHLEERHAKIIKDILSRYPYQFYVFGSRTKGTHRKLSDLDLCYIDPIPFRTIRKMENELEDSDLPFKVDVIDYNQVSEVFQKRIDQDLIPFKINKH